VKTGEPADGIVSVTFSMLPSWTFLLLFAGIFPFFIALVFANEQIVTQLPIHQSVLDRYHLLGRRAWAYFGIAVACGVAAAVSGLCVGLVGSSNRRGRWSSNPHAARNRVDACAAGKRHVTH
jgi:hypothetical protein